MNISISFDTLKEMTDFLQMMAQQRTPALITSRKKEEPKPVNVAEPVDTQKPVEASAPVEAAKAITPIGAAKPEMSAPAKSDPEKVEEKPITAADLKIFAAAYSKAGHRAELKELLTQYGEKSVTDLCEHQPDKMVEFYNAINSEAANA